MCRRSGGRAENGESRIKRQRSPRPGNAVGFSPLSNSKHPTLLTPLAAPGGQTKRRLVCQKVTKINKSETPPPTTWPKARGSHARCCSSFPSQVFPSYASSSGARRRRPEEHRGSSHSARRGLAAPLRCWGRKGKEATEQLATITTAARFKVLNVEIRLDFHLWRRAVTAEVFSAVLQFPKFTWQSDRVGGTA